MQAIFVDIANELREIEEEARMLRLATATHVALSGKNKLSEHMFWLQISGLASGVEKVYTGCERVMEQVARKIDGSPVSNEEGWHITLLRRMHNPYPGKRDPLLSEGCFKALDSLRAFRHRERNSYGTRLIPNLVVERAQEAVVAFDMFKSDVVAFEAKITADDQSVHRP